MRKMIAHPDTPSTNTTVDVRALRGKMTSLDIALGQAFKKLKPGQALCDSLVNQLANYCAGAAYLEIHDPAGRFAQRRSVARLTSVVAEALVHDVVAERAA